MLFWSENDECKDQNLQITNKRRVRLYCDVGIKHQSINQSIVMSMDWNNMK